MDDAVGTALTSAPLQLDVDYIAPQIPAEYGTHEGTITHTKPSEIQDAAPPKVSPEHDMTILNNMQMSMLEMSTVHMHLDRTHMTRWRQQIACTALAVAGSQPRHV